MIVLPTLVIVDGEVKAASGQALLVQIHARLPDITGSADAQLAVEALSNIGIIGSLDEDGNSLGR